MGYRTIKSISTEAESLLKKGKPKMSIPDKPISKNQKYIAAKDMNIDQKCKGNREDHVQKYTNSADSFSIRSLLPRCRILPLGRKISRQKKICETNTSGIKIFSLLIPLGCLFRL